MKMKMFLRICRHHLTAEGYHADVADNVGKKEKENVLCKH